MSQPEKDRQPRIGEVLVEQGRDGWVFVQIGRARGIKRFNLSRDEARQLVQYVYENHPELVTDPDGRS